MILRMAWRETRGAGRHFGYLAACVALGVAALVAVAGLGGSVERTVAGSARALMGGDVEVRSTQPLSTIAQATLRDTAGPAVDQTEVKELVGMARAGERSQLVELKAVGPGYPLHGAPVTDPAGPLASLLGDGRVLVHESLLLRLGLGVGDRMRVGEAEVTISGRIVVEPDRTAGVFSLGPRVLLTAGDLARTGLVQPGSRVRYRTLLRLPAGGDAQVLRDRLAAALPDPGLRITTYRQAQPGLRRFWDQLTTYLGLAGLVALLVGGIGVAVSVGAFVRGKLATIAILKCLGAEWRRILAVYLVQTGALGLAGSLAGAALGAALVPLLARLAGTLMPLPLTPSIAPGAVLRGLAMGLGVTVLAALWPLLEVRRVGAAFILRRDTEPRQPAARERLVALPIAAGLAALAFWQAGSLKVGALFVGGFAGGLLLLWATARLALRLARRMPRGRGPLAWRQGLANLHRPGSRAGVILVALGLAVMLAMAVAILEANLRGDLAAARAQRAPAFFFVDVQPDQVDDFARTVRASSGAEPTLIPVVRSRLTAVKGAPVEADRGRRDEQWHLTRQYVLTWAAAPPGDNVVVAGRWWTAEEARREPLISVEEDIAKSLGVGLGDALTFDVLGVPVTARIQSLRRVDWRTFSANFFVIFSPGALDGAPATYIATARVGPSDETRVQSAVTAALPNVTTIPVREVLERVTGMVDQIVFAVRLVAAVTLAASLVVVAGALAVTRAERLYQSVLLKAVGATRGAIARMFAVEYALLGVAAGLAGTALAAVLAAGVGRFVLEVPWAWHPVTLVVGVLLSAVAAVVVGFLGSFRLLGRAPLAVLRGE
jgi:putative ABC transport system permease protein